LNVHVSIEFKERENFTNKAIMNNNNRITTYRSKTSSTNTHARSLSELFT